MATYRLGVQGMSCAGCVSRVERALAAVPGVSRASVNLATSRATVQGGDEVSKAALAAAIVGAGYRTDDVAEKDDGPAVRTVVLALVLAVPLVVFSMAKTPLMPFFMGFGGLLFAAPVQLYAGAVFYRQAASELRHGAPGMSTLVALGSSAAFLYSVFVLLMPSVFPEDSRHTYFEASASVVCLVLLGRKLEARARGRASRAIERLVLLAPKTARVRRGEGSDVEEADVPVDDVLEGDVVLVRPGERVAADGVVTEGASFVDESMITGEPSPVEKKTGATVTAGTVNGRGALSFRATRVGKATTLAQIVRYVEEAQADKPRLQAVADRIAGVFVPVVLGVAAVTFAAWLAFAHQPSPSRALVSAVCVLVIACPCAMGLATPVAILVASGRAAEMGVILRRGAALEGLSRATSVLLDKTGTLTEGKPSLADVVAVGMEEGELLRLVAAAESRSEHPVGATLVAAARARGLVVPEPSAFQAEAGVGVEATVEGRTVRVTSVRSAVLGDHVEEVARLEGAGKTVVAATIDGRLAGLLSVADRAKPTSKAAVSALGKLGVSVAMVTGDGRATAEAVAREVGILRVLAELSPEEKAKEVSRLRAAGERVAFVGDGINDAPALARADAGIAMGSGTDVAIEAADVVLVRGDVGLVAEAITLCRRTTRIIHQNFFWAYAYNVVLVPLAALGMLSPTLAALAMSASSLFVVGNSLRLRRVGGAGGGGAPQSKRPATGTATSGNVAGLMVSPETARRTRV